MALPVKEHVTKTLRNQRKKNFPPNPTNVDFEIPDEWQKNDYGEQVLIFDNGPNSVNRILVFSSDLQLRQLQQSNRLEFNLKLSIVNFIKTFICTPQMGGLKPIKQYNS